MPDLSIFLTDLGGGGAERVMLNIANGFVEKGYFVDLVLVHKEGKYLAQIHPQIRLIDLNKKKLLSSFPSLIKYLREEKPRVLLSALEDTNIVAISSTKLASVNTKVFVTVHDHLSSEVNHATNLKRRFVPNLLSWFYPHADGVVAVSQGVAADLVNWSRLPLNQIKVIYNPIVTSELYDKARLPILHPWFSPEQPPVIIAVGRLTEQKDFTTLIQAFERVRQKQLARLMILGEGEDYDNLTDLVRELGLSEDVSFPGFVENPYAYMVHASVLVLSSLWEGFGNVLVEAMAVGTPVVSTNCESGPAEILDYGKYGELVPVGNVEKMAKAILMTLENKLDPEILKQRAKEFTVEKSVEQYEKLFWI